MTNHPDWEYPPGCPEILGNLIPKEILDRAIYLTHECRTEATDKFDQAQKLLDIYAQATLVITSRLHCALPCLAFGTPVIFLHRTLADQRFRGLLKYMRAYSEADTRINLDWDNPAPNPGTLSELTGPLRQACAAFVSRT